MEILLEFFFEIIVEGVGSLWMYLMCLVLPKGLSKRARAVLRGCVAVLCVVIFLSMLIGVILMCSEGALTQTVGRYLFFIPLAITLLQILLGIVVKLLQNRRAP